MITKTKWPTATIDDVLSWNPCSGYERKQLEKLGGKKQSMNALEILALGIPAEDRLWCVLRGELIPAQILHEFACRVATNALNTERRAGREPDQRSWDAIKAKRQWINGEISSKKLAAARDAAWAVAVCTARDAAWDEAWAAAGSAARAAAGSTARDEAGSAARNAAWSAAWSAAGSTARDEAWDEARRNQIKTLKRLLRSYDQDRVD
jgi:hypothetical protein